MKNLNFIIKNNEESDYYKIIINVAKEVTIDKEL